MDRQLLNRIRRTWPDRLVRAIRSGPIRQIRYKAVSLFFAVCTSSGGAQISGLPTGAERIVGGRFTFVAMPSDVGLARNLLAESIARDTFPGLPRPTRRAEIFIAPDERRFREWMGDGVPEWGAAVAYPDEHRIVMQGRGADSRAGDPRATLRHEIAHLALHEYAGWRLPHWFNEGYASFSAGEWGREQVLASSFVLALRGVPHLATLDSMISGGSARAEQGYALAHRAVADIAALDPAGGLTLLFRHLPQSRSLDAALRTAYGVTLDGFEAGWRKSTRSRYGLLALFADVSFASLVLFLLIAPFWVARRRRDRSRLAAMVAADAAAEKRDRDSAIALLLGEATAPEPDREQTPGNDDQIKGG